RLRAALILGLFWSTACSIDDDGGIATVSDSGSPDGTVPADAGIDAAAADAAPPRVPMGTEA
ncbi:MAG: hypothetical protein GWN73_43360, partial [Actinobacteria bacterium]|nr:hypothetical protein [Actinomycetota bacterium]NIS37416.1 hypothetical protein [Actinomycetota bacterium]NIU71843.1 hypothetical protein [Actinomycetota bacterium]NIW33789.1 hypothetical protein [Actinomycetota bacterium]